MPCATGYYYFAPFYICKLNGITNQVPPSTCIGTYEQGIFFSFFHFMNHEGFRFVNHIKVGIKIFFVEGYKFKKNIVVERKPHALCILPTLVRQKAFAGQVGFNVSNGFAPKLAQAFFVRF